MNKTKVLETLETLPNEFSTEDLIDRLLFVEKVEQGIRDVEAGEVMSLEQAKELLEAKWSK